MNSKSIRVAIAFLLMTPSIYAQDFKIKRLELEGDKVNLYYDLKDTTAQRIYTVHVFSSKDNYVTRLEKVSGDVGLEVKPGDNHKITWEAKQELGAFAGKIGLEVRGRIYIPFVKLEGLNKVYKRGKTYPFVWTGGTQQNILNFDLYKGNKLVHPNPNVANVYQTKIKMPTSVKAGKGYYFKITDSKNKDQIVNTAPFKIKKKVPFLVKAVPVLAVGGAIYLLTGINSGGIPDPPKPGAN